MICKWSVGSIRRGRAHAAAAEPDRLPPFSSTDRSIDETRGWARSTLVRNPQPPTSAHLREIDTCPRSCIVLRQRGRSFTHTSGHDEGARPNAAAGDHGRGQEEDWRLHASFDCGGDVCWCGFVRNQRGPRQQQPASTRVDFRSSSGFDLFGASRRQRTLVPRCSSSKGFGTCLIDRTDARRGHLQFQSARLGVCEAAVGVRFWIDPTERVDFRGLGSVRPGSCAAHGARLDRSLHVLLLGGSCGGSGLASSKSTIISLARFNKSHRKQTMREVTSTFKKRPTSSMFRLRSSYERPRPAAWSIEAMRFERLCITSSSSLIEHCRYRSGRSISIDCSGRVESRFRGLVVSAGCRSAPP